VRLDERQAKIKRSKEQFTEYRKDLNHKLQEKMAKEIVDVGEQFKDALLYTGRGPPHLVNVPPFKHKDPEG
jgi:radical SAM superfamily enzyme with C-terminal helix-hairpin-helix motif